MGCNVVTYRRFNAEGGRSSKGLASQPSVLTVNPRLDWFSFLSLVRIILSGIC